MSVPVSRLSRLSLEEMPPMTRSSARAASRATPVQALDHSNSSSDGESDYGNASDYDDDEPTTVKSPTRLLYNLDQLSEPRRVAVRDTFKEPPIIALQRCRRIGNTYAFQMTELVTRSVRIRAPDGGDGASPRLSCSCEQEDRAPCRHLVWLLDQLLKETLYHHDGSKPLRMTDHGYAEEMGDPFQNISDFHLDVLADGLHCQVVNPELYSEDELDYHRVLEARELLASVYSKPPEEFRPDIFNHPVMDEDVLKNSDLDCTVFRMLLDNPHLFHYFLSLSRPSDPIDNVFRKLSQRVDRVLRELNALPFATTVSSPISGHHSSDSTGQKVPRDIAWAARHLLGIVGLIRSSIYTRDRPLKSSEALSAVHTLVHILASVVDHNGRDTSTGVAHNDSSLYSRLIGDCREADFVIAELGLLPEAASHVVDRLEAISERIGPLGVPVAYMEKFNNLLRRLRTSSTSVGIKRQLPQKENDREPKRMK
ncbi:hypothetical protein QQS21_011808 [Conoideocrella luteorostrata]|uniref:SWIM-type domain-containing protein n=1 Tax=Conoideocrella luteorostrata TaxID=1105319 RepID=A0AAJ0FVH1_9HYPO|nr:hypothetical protein QQS21_011808 [Conoideocrella luteorostrata]